MSADYLPVGTRVTFSFLDVLRRTREAEHVGNTRIYMPTVRRWKRAREAYPFLKDEGPQAGVVVGVRTKRTGYTEGGWDEMATFVPMESHRVYMVAYSLHKNPVFLLLEDVKPEVSVAS